jgi:hypothetical protein
MHQKPVLPTVFSDSSDELKLGAVSPTNLRPRKVEEESVSTEYPANA